MEMSNEELAKLAGVSNAEQLAGPVPDVKLTPEQEKDLVEQQVMETLKKEIANLPFDPNALRHVTLTQFERRLPAWKASVEEQVRTQVRYGAKRVEIANGGAIEYQEAVCTWLVELGFTVEQTKTTFTVVLAL